MTRGSIKHDHSRKGVIPGSGRLLKSRKSAAKKKRAERLAQTAADVDTAATRIAQEGQLVPIKHQGKIVKHVGRPTRTPPPHQSFRQGLGLRRKKLSHDAMRAIVRSKTIRTRGKTRTV